MNQEKIGKFIQEKRKSKNLTQQELAKKLGVTNRTISNWEKGKCLPDYNLLIPVTKELEISISELLTGEQEENKQEQKKVVEKFIDFLKHIEKIKIKKYKTIGLTVFIIGIVIILINLLFIPSASYLSTVSKMYIELGCIISTLGLLYMTQREKIFKLILINISFIILLASFLLFQDYVNVKYFRSPPRYYINSERKIFTGNVYYQTKLYDVYACEESMYTSEIGKDYIIVKKDRKESMYENLKKYCNLPY